MFNKKVIIAESYESCCLGAAVLRMKSPNVISRIEEVEKFCGPKLQDFFIYTFKTNGSYKQHSGN